jgi:hypothetical protein
VVLNLKSAQSKPFRLTVELLDATGRVLATQIQDVPTMSPHQSLTFDWQVPGRGIAGWRYRSS